MGFLDNFRGFSPTSENPYLQFGNKKQSELPKSDLTEIAFDNVRKDKESLAGYIKSQIIQKSKGDLVALRSEISVVRTDYKEKQEENNVRNKLVDIYKLYDKEKISARNIRELQGYIGAKQDGDFGPNTFSKLIANIPEKYKNTFVAYIKNSDSVKLPSLMELLEGFGNVGPQKKELGNISVDKINTQQGNIGLDRKEEEKLSFFSIISKKVDSLVDSFNIKTFNAKDILAIIQFESFFNPNAKSKKKVENSSVGLMAITIHPINELKRFGKKVIIEGESLYDKVTEKVGKLEGKIKQIKESLFNVDTNLTVGTSYLKILEEKWGGKKYSDKKYQEIVSKSDKMKPRIKTLLKNKNMEMDDDVFSKVIDKLKNDEQTQKKYYLLSERYNTASKPMKGEIMAHKFYYGLLITYLSEFLEKNGNFNSPTNVA